MAGFAFEETFAGSFRSLASPRAERPMTLTLRGRLALPRGEAAVSGEVDLEGLADRRHCEGAIALGRAPTTLVYRLDFTADDGAPCAFTGDRPLAAGGLAAPFSLLSGAVRDARGAELGRALLRFDLQRDLLRYLRSLRPWL